MEHAAVAGRHGRPLPRCTDDPARRELEPDEGGVSAARQAGLLGPLHRAVRARPGAEVRGELAVPFQPGGPYELARGTARSADPRVDEEPGPGPRQQALRG